MTVNRPSITTTALKEAFVSIEIMSSRPDLSIVIDPPDNPGRVVGFYNPQTDGVELYITSATGDFWIPISN